MGRAWLRVIAGSADAELVGLVDLDVEAARRAAGDAGFDVQLAGSVDELLAA